MKLLEFSRITNAFNYVFEKKLKAKETVYVKMPTVSANKRGINDIGWQAESGIVLYGTMSRKPQNDDALWQLIAPMTQINRTISALKIENTGAEEASIVVRCILN